jgi:hypothetical protein
MSFNEKRGNLGFGWQKQDSQESFAKRFVKKMKGYLNRVIELERHPQEDALVIRYENLVLKQTEEIAKVASWLGLVLDDSYIKEHQQAILDKHASSASPSASVAKWKTKLSPETQAIFQSELAGELEQLNFQ